MKQENYMKTELEGMSAVGIYMLLEKKGADVFGLWAADKNELLSAYGKQVGFKGK